MEVSLHSSILFKDARAHLSSYEGGSDVEAGVLGVGNPLLVNLHQLPDALQHFAFIKQLHREKELDVSGQLLSLLFSLSLLRNEYGPTGNEID